MRSSPRSIRPESAHRPAEIPGCQHRDLRCSISAEALPLADRRYYAVTIAFGIRNIPRIEAALGEAYRVLRIGGRFLCLEFSTVEVPGLAALYDFYSFNVIPALGR